MADQEHLDKLKEGIAAWKHWRNDHRDIRPDLSNVTLRGANISHATLRNADLFGANISHATLRGADISGARVSLTTFGDFDFSAAKGLDTIWHDGPSTIGIDTIYRSQGNIPEAFLKGAGVDDTFITYIRSLVGKPIEYYSCFISVRLVSPKHAKAWGWAGKEYSFHN
jgi:hypothetical protein